MLAHPFALLGCLLLLQAAVGCLPAALPAAPPAASPAMNFEMDTIAASPTAFDQATAQTLDPPGGTGEGEIRPSTPTPPPIDPDVSTGEPETRPPVEPIQLAWFYKPPADGDLAFLQQGFDFFILTLKDEPARDALRRDARAGGETAPILQYLLLIEIQNPGDCDREPYGNQVAYQPGDYCRLLDAHPDWFLYDTNGEPVVNDKTVYMDPGNPGYREFWLNRARLAQEVLGWHGVFLDNVEASLAGWRVHGRAAGALPLRYPDDASYQAAIEGFLEYLYLNYFQPQGRPLWANITSLVDSETWFRYLAYLDGAMIEAFAVDWDDGYRSPEDWERQLALVEDAQALGKSVLLVAQGRHEDNGRQQFALASYLLVNNGLAYFRYADYDHYNQAWWYENYLLELGMPLEPRRSVDGVYQRRFANGLVTVDPANHTASIEVAP